MTKQVSGFMTDNGNFFEHEEEAEFHEADQDLRDKLLDAEVDPDKFMPLAVQFDAEVRRYVNASKAVNKEITWEGNVASVGNLHELERVLNANTPDDEDRVHGLTPAELQPTNRRSAVSDVGSSASTEEVRDDGKGDGA